MAWLRDFGIAWRYGARSLPAQTEWQLQHNTSLIYVGIVVVARHVNLWRNHTTVCFVKNIVYLIWGYISNYRTIWKQDVEVEVMIWYMIWCGGWPDSYQERNALKPHGMNTITLRNSWQLSVWRKLRRSTHCYQNHGSQVKGAHA